MKSLFLTIVFALTVLLSACGSDDPPCSCTGEIKPGCAWECSGDLDMDSPENVGKAVSALSLSATAAYSVSYAAGYGPSSATYCNDPASSTWCECNVVYTDAAPRCNEPIATMFWEFPAPSCVVSSAVLTYDVSQGSAGRTVDIRRILRPVVTPPMGLAGTCVTSAYASWWRTGTEAWTVGGAKGDGTDRTAEGVTRTINTTAIHSESFDVTALVQGCPATGACVLSQYADIHVSVWPGATLNITCGAPSVCGDNITEGSETCDDGNTTAGDGCSATCALEAGWTCSPICETTCGDNIVAGSEACDDGNASPTDGCISCVLATCGDGFVRSGVEQCDDGNVVNTDTCVGCALAFCGDGFVGPGEECDDGNAVATDACVSCALAVCGDGFTGPGEACDDGNVVSGDGCSATCGAEVCSCE